jgi:transcriptional regulator with XRE-family HTH domain
LQLESAKPNCLQYPTAIITVGDEFRAVRIDRGLTQQEVGQMLGINRNFVYELELNQHQLTIYSLHIAYQFLGYIPEILKIDESILQGQLFGYRIRHGYTYTELAKKIGLDKSTLARFEKGGNIKIETRDKIIVCL